MPPIPDAPRSQQTGWLITLADLPPGGHLPSGFPGEREGMGPSDTINAQLGCDDRASTDEHNQAQLDSKLPETIDGRWRYIEHAETHTRVHIRLQRQTLATPAEVRITGVVFLPWRPGGPITSKMLRELPIARIEASINMRLFDMKRVDAITGRRIRLASDRRIHERDILAKITPGPKRNPDSYPLVALQHHRLAQQFHPNPSGGIARINDVLLSTAQGWLTKTRDLGLLPPGRRGRAG